MSESIVEIRTRMAESSFSLSTTLTDVQTSLGEVTSVQGRVSGALSRIKSELEGSCIGGECVDMHGGALSNMEASVKELVEKISFLEKLAIDRRSHEEFILQNQSQMEADVCSPCRSHQEAVCECSCASVDELSELVDIVWGEEMDSIIENVAAGMRAAAATAAAVGATPTSAGGQQLECDLRPSGTDGERPDYAQRGAGGSILSKLTSATYNPDSIPFRRVLHMVGVSTGLGFPEDALSVNIALGHCWPMQGSSGALAVRLARPVSVGAISIDHVSKRDAIDIHTAPRNFAVYTYSSEDDEEGEGEWLLTGEYDVDKGENVQTFFAPVPSRPVSVVRLVIESNHGNPSYTCLYRMRVHGEAQFLDQ
jgi:hypothetical protein